MEAFAALAVSVVAVVATTLIGIRQARLANGSNHLPVILKAFKESREPGWFEDQEYVLNELTTEFPDPVAWRNLPDDVRARVNTNGIFYDDLGKLVAHGMIDEDLAIGSYGMTVVQLWDVLAPYVYEERSHTSNFWIYFENLAARIADKDPNTVYAKLRLRQRPPQQQIIEATPQPIQAPAIKSSPALEPGP
jgi:hypothetical protein